MPNKKTSKPIKKLEDISDDGPKFNMDVLVEQVATGKRILLFPPGIFVFLSVMTILPIIATVFLGGGSIGWLLINASPGEKAFTQFAIIILDVLLVVGSSLMVAKGKKRYLKVIKYYILFLASISSIFLAYHSVIYDTLNSSFMWSAIVSSFTLWLMQTPSYLVFVEYMYLLQKRKRDIFDEQNDELS